MRLTPCNCLRALLTTVLLALPSTASAQELHVSRVGSDLQLSWSEAEPGARYDLYRAADPSDVPGSGTLLVQTNDLEFLDESSVAGLSFYDLVVFPASGGCTDDGKEENDDAATAATPDAGWMDLQLCADDEDWFRVPLLAGQGLRAAITYDRDVGVLGLELLAPDGVTPLSSDPYVVRADAAADGDYFLRVMGGMGVELPYRMHVEADFVPRCVSDVSSPNQSLAEAIPSWPEEYQLLWQTLCDDQEDWFTHTVLPGQTLEVYLDPFGDISFVPEDENWIIVELIDTDGATVLERFDTRFEGWPYISWDSPAGGRHFVRIQSYMTDNSFWGRFYELGAGAY